LPPLDQFDIATYCYDSTHDFKAALLARTHCPSQLRFTIRIPRRSCSEENGLCIRGCWSPFARRFPPGHLLLAIHFHGHRPAAYHRAKRAGSSRPTGRAPIKASFGEESSRRGSKSVGTANLVRLESAGQIKPCSETRHIAYFSASIDAIEDPSAQSKFPRRDVGLRPHAYC